MTYSPCAIPQTLVHSVIYAVILAGVDFHLLNSCILSQLQCGIGGTSVYNEMLI